MALDHYISQVHLKRFYSPALDNLMFALTKNELKRFTPKARDVCRIEDGNTNEYLEDPRAVEHFLRDVEGNYNRAANNLEVNKPDQGTIYSVAGFVAYVMTCSPAAMRINSGPIAGTLKATAKTLEKLGELPDPPPELGASTFVELIDSGVVHFEIDQRYPQAIGISNILERVIGLGNARWEILVNNHKDCPFFTSDYPIGSEPTADKRVLSRTIPLTPSLAIRIFPRIDLPKEELTIDFKGFSSDRRSISRFEAISINRLLVQSAENMIFYSTDLPWIMRFVERNRHYRVDTVTTEFGDPGRLVQWHRQEIVEYKRPT